MAGPSYGLLQMQFIFFVACGGLFSVLFLHFSFSFVRLFCSHSVRLLLSSDFSVRLCSSFLIFFPLVIFIFNPFVGSLGGLGRSWVPLGASWGRLRGILNGPLNGLRAS